MPPTYTAILAAAKRVIGSLNTTKLTAASTEGLAKRVSAAIAPTAREELKDPSLALARRLVRQGERESVTFLTRGGAVPRQKMETFEEWLKKPLLSPEQYEAKVLDETGVRFRLDDLEEFVSARQMREIAGNLPNRVLDSRGTSGLTIKEELLEQWLADKYRNMA